MKNILLISLLCFSISCKKKNQEPSVNPNISSKVLNISINGSLNDVDTNIDLDNDGYFDFKIYSSHPGGDPNAAQIGINSFSTGTYAMEFAIYAQGLINEMWKPIAAGIQISNTTGNWNPDAIIYYNDITGPVGKLGVNDVGDVYFAYRYRNIMQSLTAYYYGYIKLEVSEHHKISMKEITHQTISGVSIAAGQK